MSIVRVGADTTAAYRDLLNAVHRLDLAARRSADRELIAGLGIGRAMFLVLDLMADTHARPSQQAIADRLGLTRAAVSRHVIDAVDAGLVGVRPSPTSRREKELALTPRGRRIVADGRRLRRAAARRALADVPAEAIATTLDLLARLEATLSPVGQDAPSRPSQRPR